MNLIYASCLKNPEYLKQLDLFLNSLILKGDIQPNTEILVITDINLKSEIEAKHKTVKLWAIDCEDTYDAYTARTKIMEWSDIANYDKILYLDIDILIANPISAIFNLPIDDDKLYAVEECSMMEHGADFFDWTIINPEERSFTSAILLFRNSQFNRAIWHKITAHIYVYKQIHNSLPPFCDQSFIIYNFRMHGKFDIKQLTKFAINCTYGNNQPTIKEHELIEAVSKGLVIIHHPCYTAFKIEAMNRNWYLINTDAFCRQVLDSGSTLVSMERLMSLKTHCARFKKSNFTFVECGVAKGGCLAVMAHNSSKTNKIYGFDSFEGMPEITDKDLGDYNKTSPLEGFGSVGCNLSGGIDTVYSNFSKLKVPMTNVKLVQGFFENTLTDEVIKELGNIAVLRLDGDWYNSTKVCLDRLYNSVVDGGVIIIDDYGHFIGAKTATDEFRAQRGIDSPLIKTDYTECYWIKHIKSTNIHEDIWTCSDEMRGHISEQFTGKNYKITEIGAHKGYSTGHLAGIFSHVYAVDNSDLWTDFSRQLNRDKSNITYIKLDLYKESWAKLPDCDVAFIDAVHHYETCLSDINNSIAHFKSLKYIILDDYGVFEGVKRAVDEGVASGRFTIVQFIGLTDIPSMNGIVRGSHEGVIVRLIAHSSPTAS